MTNARKIKEAIKQDVDSMTTEQLFAFCNLFEDARQYGISQFAEAITSFGQGTGIPVTIRYTEKDGKIPPCDFVSKREQFTDEFKGKTKKCNE